MKTSLFQSHISRDASERFDASSTGTTRSDGPIKDVHQQGGNDVDRGCPTCHVATKAESLPVVGDNTSNNMGCLDGLWRGCLYRLGGHGQVAMESKRVVEEVIEN